MRIRITSRPPLTPIRAWFAVTATSTNSITELKREICDAIPALREEENVPIDPEDLCLSVDDFALLDSGGVDVLRENDLVCIEVTKRPATNLKRKRVDEVEEVEAHRRKGSRKASSSRHDTVLKKPLTNLSSFVTSKQLQKGQHPVKGANSSSSSSSSGDSDSDSSSSSSSSSSTDSSSDSDSDSAPSIHPATAKSTKSALPRALQALEARAAAILIQSTNKPPSTPAPVPPGEGKRTTQSRNERRRRKKLAEKEAAERAHAAATALSADPNSTNAIPLGVRAQQKIVDVSLQETAQNSSSGSVQIEANVNGNAEQRVGLTLSNKNKKRGFKKAMEGAVPERIVFSNSMNVNVSVEEPVAAATVSASSSRRNNSPTKPPRLVTPSEKQDLGVLPDNMFVTSVELEADGRGNWDRRKKKKMREAYAGYAGEQQEEQQQQNEGKSDVVELDYGTPDVVEDASPVKARAKKTVDWEAAEQKWDQLPMIRDDLTMLDAEQLVGWKTLGINPVTCSPDMLVQLARVESVDHAARKVNIAVLTRPGEADIGFRGTRRAFDEEEMPDQAPGDVEEEEEEEAFVRESVDFASMLAEQWKLVNV